MFKLEAISAQRLYRLIAEKIAQKIRSGEFPVGGRLPAERDLAEILQVSRSSVREALIALELSGYVEVRVGSGVYVTMPRSNAGGAVIGSADVDAMPAISRIAMDMGPFELLEARLLIEPECAALAAQKGSEAQLDAVREANDAMSGPGAPSHHDRAFHAAIAAACGNSALEAVVLHIWDLSQASPVYQRLDKHFVGDKVWDTALIEHDRIADAILDRDPIRARHAMYSHLVAIMARLREDFADSIPDEDQAASPDSGSAVRTLRAVSNAESGPNRNDRPTRRPSRRKP